MRRFPLRIKIAGFAVGLVVLATGLVALFTVILPWRAKLKQQERLASSLATPLGLGIVRSADGKAHLEPSRVQQLVLNSSRIPGIEILYALFWDEKGNLDTSASSVNRDQRPAPQGAGGPSAALSARSRGVLRGPGHRQDPPRHPPAAHPPHRVQGRRARG